jgi:hypothetical protein
MEYRIDQYSDDIFVYIGSLEFLVVRRTFSFFGKLTSKFYQHDKLILETTYDIFLFRKFISIECQNLSIPFSLMKVKGEYAGILNDLTLQVVRRYFKNPVYYLLVNGSKAGEISTKLTGITETPKEYFLKFYSDSESNFYLLLLFLMGVSPTMDS